MPRFHCSFYLLIKNFEKVPFLQHRTNIADQSDEIGFYIWHSVSTSDESDNDKCSNLPLINPYIQIGVPTHQYPTLTKQIYMIYINIYSYICIYAFLPLIYLFISHYECFQTMKRARKRKRTHIYTYMHKYIYERARKHTHMRAHTHT